MSVPPLTGRRRPPARMTEPRTPAARDEVNPNEGNATAASTVEASRELARRIGPRSYEVVTSPPGDAALRSSLAAGFAFEDAVLQVIYPHAHNERAVLDEFLRHMSADIERTCERAIQPRLRGRLDESDVRQSVIGDLLPKLPEIQFRTRSEFCAYLHNKMRWKATDRGRQRSAAQERERLVAEGERGAPRAEVQQPVEALIEVEEERRMQEVISQMTPREQGVLRLNLEGFEPKEIAERLGMTRDAVYKALQRGMARAKLMG